MLGKQAKITEEVFTLFETAELALVRGEEVDGIEPQSLASIIQERSAHATAEKQLEEANLEAASKVTFLFFKLKKSKCKLNCTKNNF